MSRESARRGHTAVEALIEEYDVLSRTDETDSSFLASRPYDLRWAHDRIGAAQRAADADVVTYEEALEWLAGSVGRELPDEALDDEER